MNNPEGTSMSTGTARSRQHISKANRRSMASAAVRISPTRTAYRGVTRSRDTQTASGHPMAGLWSTWAGARHSSRPDIRRHAARKLATLQTAAWVDEVTL